MFKWRIVTKVLAVIAALAVVALMVSGFVWGHLLARQRAERDALEAQLTMQQRELQAVCDEMSGRLTGYDAAIVGVAKAAVTGKVNHVVTSGDAEVYPLGADGYLATVSYSNQFDVPESRIFTCIVTPAGVISNFVEHPLVL